MLRLFLSQSHTSYINRSCTPFSLFNGSNHRTLFFYSTGLTTTNTNDSLADFLVTTLGFTEQESHATSTKLTRVRTSRGTKNASEFNFSEKANSVITFLTQTGLQLSHIRKAVTKEPRILFSNVEKTLKPKINLLSDLGFSGSDLNLVISMTPNVLILRLEPAIQSLREFVGSDENVVMMLKKIKGKNMSSIAKYLLRNVALLESEYGISRDKLRKYLLQQPSWMLVSTDTLKKRLVRVEERWGIAKDSSVFMSAVLVLGGQTEETIESKCQIFRRYGWAESDITKLVKCNPFCLGYNGARTERSLVFLMNELGYQPAYLASRVSLFTLSLDKRIMPRYKVLEVVKENGLLKKDYVLYPALRLNESEFLKKFIEPFKDVVPGLLEEYKSSISSTVVPSTRRKVSSTLVL